MSIVPRTSENGLPVLTAAVAGTTEDIVEILADDQGYLIVANAVLDEDGDWVPMTQPNISLTTSGITIATTEYKDNRFEYDLDGYVIYAGEHLNMNAPESDTDWVLYKMYYDVLGNTVQIKSQNGSWQDRATLVWE